MRGRDEEEAVRQPDNWTARQRDRRHIIGNHNIYVRLTTRQPKLLKQIIDSWRWAVAAVADFALTSASTRSEL